MDDDHGQLLADRYRLTDLLGQGGMGAVWRAYDEQLGRDVAVKELRLPEHLGAEERANWIARLEREARAAARLKHPGIVTVYDRLTGADGRPWIVMELVTGGSLDDLLHRQGPLSPQHVAHIGRQVAAALSAAHLRGITHRDIKPANILLEDGRAVLTDFGIAALEGDATLTATGMIMGTPAFMAPEQVRGLPATAASDLWSLGATLYTAVEGHPPFAGTAPSAVLVAVVTEDPAPAVQAGPLTPMLEGLLRKDPAGRLTMQQLQAQLDQVADAPPPPNAPPAGPAHWPTAPAQAPVIPPAGPARRPTAPAGTPVTARHRIFRWGAWISAAVLASVAAAILIPDQGEESYQNNLRAVEAMGHPPDFTVKSKARVDGGRARVVYMGGPVPGAPSLGQKGVIGSWLQAVPGVSTVGMSGVDASCMTKEYGCILAVDLKDGYTEPSVLDAQIHKQDGKLALQVTVGPFD
ncbi:serine/threonine-protein kinase [Streptomyces sp. NPDC058471]|uniref:serine/threonine-protein kinase n=1 Tax=Streptomyces sp. NPDC058471 TaxID=3346516 RepID=UPI00365CA75F